MGELKGEMSGLKAHAEQTLFVDWQVTPAMKERLYERIRTNQTMPVPYPRARVIGGVAAVAAAAMLVVIGQTTMPRTMMPSQVGTEQKENLPPLASRPARPENQGAIPLTITSTVVAGSLKEANGTSFQVQIADAYGNDVRSNTPGVPGIEVQPGRKVVRNAEYAFRVKDARAAQVELERVAVSSGGYVVESSVTRSDDTTWQGRLVLRIPAAQYGGAVAQIRLLGENPQERQWSQDVTEQFIDQEARLKVLTEHEAKLNQLALKAATFEDWLKVTQQLNETRTQLESIQGRLKKLNNEVDYSTLTISLVQPASDAPAPAPTDAGLWGHMGYAFSQSIAFMLSLGRKLLVGLSAALPFLLPASLIGLLALVALRARRRRDG